MLTTIRNLFSFTVGAYGFAISAFLILSPILTEAFELVALYNTSAHLLWLAALVLLLLALLLRFWRTALVLLLPALAFVVTYGGQFFGSSNYIGTSTFSVMTYNILWRNSDYADTIRLIREADADIVAIQELGNRAAERLEAALADAYPYRALHPHDTGTIGQGILSRYPILESTFWQYDFPSFRQQRAVVDVHGTEIVVYNLHLNHPFRGREFFNVQQRAAQVQDILQRISEERARVVLLGDFNMTDLNEDYTRLDQHLTDAYFDAGSGLGWTFSLRVRGYALLLARLDYIFIGSGLDTVETRVWDTAGGSDHRPVWAQLSIYDPTASYP